MTPQTPPTSTHDNHVANDLLETAAQPQQEDSNINFFETLNWNGSSHPADKVARPSRDASPAVPRAVTPNENLMDKPIRSVNNRSSGGFDAAEAAERAAGIRVGGDRPPPPEEVYEENSANLLDWGDSDVSSHPVKQQVVFKPNGKCNVYNSVFFPQPQQPQADLFGLSDPFAPGGSSAPSGVSSKSQDDWFGFSDISNSNSNNFASSQPTNGGILNVTTIFNVQLF